MRAGQGTNVAADDRIETFFYVLSGEFRLRIEDDLPQQLKSGAYALVGPHIDFEVRTVSDGTLLCCGRHSSRFPALLRREPSLAT